MKMQIILFDGFDELDAIGPFEVLQNAQAAGANIQVELVTLGQAREVPAAHGLRVHSHAPLSTGEMPGVLIVPGGGWNSRASQGARAEVQRGEIPQAISVLCQSGVLVAGVCTGAMLIASAGLLKGRAAVTHHGAIEDLRQAGARIIHARVVDDGDLITSGGITSGLDLALWLVERFAGAPIAQEVEQRMEYERRGTVWRRAGPVGGARHANPGRAHEP